MAVQDYMNRVQSRHVSVSPSQKSDFPSGNTAKDLYIYHAWWLLNEEIVSDATNCEVTVEREMSSYQ